MTIAALKASLQSRVGAVLQLWFSGGKWSAVLESPHASGLGRRSSLTAAIEAAVCDYDKTAQRAMVARKDVTDAR